MNQTTKEQQNDEANERKRIKDSDESRWLDTHSDDRNHKTR